VVIKLSVLTRSSQESIAVSGIFLMRTFEWRVSGECVLVCVPVATLIVVGWIVAGRKSQVAGARHIVGMPETCDLRLATRC
jgi:hypothetical protein